jgi:hypothetical protein
MLSDIALKKELISEFASISDTADGSSLDSLKNVLARASPVLERFAGRATKSADRAMLNTYNYPFELSPSQQYDKDITESRKRHDAEDEAYMIELSKTWTPEFQAQKIQDKANEESRRARYATLMQSDDNKKVAKEAALALWYQEFCRDVDSKIATITSNPGYSSEIVEPVAKKSKPNAQTPVQTRIFLGHSFREEIVDHDVLVSNLHTQLKTAQETETKVMKTFNIRKEKARIEKAAQAAAKAAKKAGGPSPPLSKKSRAGKSDLEIKTQDHSDLELANWFKLHSIAIKAKITLLTPVGFVWF